MILTALVVSIVSLLVAVTAAYFAYVQAHFTRKQALVEADRRREERGPVLVGEIESLGSWYRLRLRLESSWPLRSLYVEIVDTEGVSFTHSQNGVDPAAPAPIRTAQHGVLQPGESATWRIQLDDDWNTHLRLRVLARGWTPEEEWTRTLKIDPPRRLPRLLV